MCAKGLECEMMPTGRRLSGRTTASPAHVPLRSTQETCHFCRATGPARVGVHILHALVSRSWCALRFIEWTYDIFSSVERPHTSRQRSPHTLVGIQFGLLQMRRHHSGDVHIHRACIRQHTVCVDWTSPLFYKEPCNQPGCQTRVQTLQASTYCDSTQACTGWVMRRRPSSKSPPGFKTTRSSSSIFYRCRRKHTPYVILLVFMQRD